MNLIYHARLFLLMICLGGGFQAAAQGSSSVIERSLESALQNGKAAELIKICDERVDITLDGQRQSYAKRQAELVLAKFFSDHPPARFHTSHKGGADHSLYLFGNYATTSHLEFEVYFFLRIKDDAYKLNEIRFERK